MTDMRLMLQILGDNRGLTRSLGQSSTAVGRFTQGAKREFQALKQTLTSVQGQLAGLGLTAGFTAQMWQMARLDQSLTRIALTAGEGQKAVAGLRSDLYGMAQSSGESVQNLQNGFNVLIQTGLTMHQAKASLESINMAMTVTGANAETLAKALAVGSSQFGVNLADRNATLLFLDKMVMAGRLGNAELENMAAIFPTIATNAKLAKLSIDETLALTEAFSKMEMNPEMLRTLVKTTLRMFSDVGYMREAMKATGNRYLFFDQNKRQRPVADVFTDLRASYGKIKNDEEQRVWLHRAFGKMDTETRQGVITMMTTNALQDFKTFPEQIRNAGGTLKKDLDEATNNMVAQFGRVGATLKKDFDAMTKPLRDTMADVVKWGLDKKSNGGLGLTGKDIMQYGAMGVIGTVVAARLGGRMGQAGLKLLQGGASTAVGVGEGLLLQQAAGVTPVFVVNMPGGGIPPGLPTVSSNGRTIPWGFAAGAGVATAITAGIPLSFALSSTAQDHGWGTKTWGRNSREYEVMGIGGKPANNITLNMNIDSKGRTYVTSNDLHTRLDVNRRGSFFDDAMLSSGY